MNNPSTKSSFQSGFGETTLQHYLIVLLHRKWLVLGVFLLVSAATFVVASRLPNVYTSETVILVDPQQVPSDYVRSTVSGDIRDRLSTLSQQILSATRLQMVIDTFNLYPNERKKMHSDEVIALMRNNVTVNMVSGSGGAGDLQAFKIGYSNNDPALTAKVTNELARLFIEENLNAREQLSTGTTEFLDHQLEETKKDLEILEAKIGDFKIKHLGEMPEQQQTNIEILSQLQSRMQVLSDAMYRAQQQKSYLQAVIMANNQQQQSQAAASHSDQQNTPPAMAYVADPQADTQTPSEKQLADLLSRYGENYPDVKRLRAQVQEEQRERQAEESEREEAQRKAAAEAKAATANAATAGGADSSPSPTLDGQRVSPEVQAQLASLEAEITKDKQDQQDIIASISSYQSKLEAEPIREQEIADLVRDYAISKEHYSQLLEKKLSADMATQLEIRQKGEKFTVLDPAQVPEKPTRPNRLSIDLAGSLAGLALGLAVALFTELLATTFIAPSEVSLEVGLPVLGAIPSIATHYDRRVRKQWMIAGAAGGLAMVVAACVFLYLRFGGQMF